jgi:hypothetical protein
VPYSSGKVVAKQQSSAICYDENLMEVVGEASLRLFDSPYKILKVLE